jgi:hypothetical protein
MPTSRRRKPTNYQKVRARNRRERARKVNGPAVMQIHEEIPPSPKPGSAVTRRRDGARFEVQPDRTWRRVREVEPAQARRAA